MHIRGNFAQSNLCTDEEKEIKSQVIILVFPFQNLICRNYLGEKSEVYSSCIYNAYCT